MSESEGEKSTKKSDFSIEHILNKAGEKKSDLAGHNGIVSLVALPWLQCTRYCPPKIPRKFLHNML